MNKAVKLVHCFLLLCLFSVLTGQDLRITMDLPETVYAGSEFEVRLTIEKGNLTDYSRYSQELPYGLSAVNVSSPNADFSFEEQRIRIIWLKLPEENLIQVIYRIRVDERLKGTFTLDGNFAYVVDEERKYTDIPVSDPITIIPNSRINQSLVVDIRDFENVVKGITQPETVEGFAMVIRQKPVQLGDGSVLIRLLVRNPEGGKYAKIEETIPEGYMFEEVETAGGIVSFSASQVKYIWMKLPADPEFMVSYRLLPKAGERQEAVNITGVYSYTIGNSNYEDPVIEMETNLENLTPGQKHNLLLTGILPGESGTPGPQVPAIQPAEPVSSPAPESESRFIQGTRVLESGIGVYYRIQLIALRMPFNGNLHFSRLGIDGDIRVEKHEGLYKYSAGSFSDYLAASRYKKTIENRPGLEDCFIVAYRNGLRISIEEAFTDSN
ncbi:MAG: hypothetical protein JXR52_05810 [Bacteroidales bacterium]|nr:hypothetical protein [Bacteroidales bacterium]MBN2698323.1 hypothetical protein [Bacteroidales bacterium]